MSLLKLKKEIKHKLGILQQITLAPVHSKRTAIAQIQYDQLSEVLHWIDSYKAKPRKPRFVKPKIDELATEFHAKGMSSLKSIQEAASFINHYESCGWVIGGNGKKMVSWQHSVAGWIARNKQKNDERHSARIRDTTDDGYQPVFNRSEKGKPVRFGQ